MNRYTNGLITAAEFMEFLVNLAREVSADRDRAKKLGLTEDELAFYDAFAADPSAVEQMEDSLLAKIAHELYEQIRKDVTVGWKVSAISRSADPSSWRSATSPRSRSPRRNRSP